MSPALAGRFFTIEPPGSPITSILYLEIILHNLKNSTILGTRRERRKGRNFKHGYSSQETYIHGRGI